MQPLTPRPTRALLAMRPRLWPPEKSTWYWRRSCNCPPRWQYSESLSARAVTCVSGIHRSSAPIAQPRSLHLDHVGCRAPRAIHGQEAYGKPLGGAARDVEAQFLTHPMESQLSCLRHAHGDGYEHGHRHAQHWMDMDMHMDMGHAYEHGT